MSGSLGSLVVELSANVAQFQNDMGKASHLARQEMEKINSSVETAKKGFELLGATFAAKGFVESLHGAVEQMDSLYNLSKRFSTSVETLSGLSLVAKNADVDIASLAKGFKTLSKELSESPEKFDALGIHTQNATEAFIKLATASKGLTDSDLTNFATKFLGKTGNELIPALSMTEEELRKLIARGSELSGVTSEMAAKANEYQDKVHELDQAFLGLKSSLAISVIPALQKATEEMTEGIRISGGFFSAIGLFGTINPFKTTGENVKALRQELDDLQASRERYVKSNADVSALDMSIAAIQKKLEYEKWAQRREALALNPEGGYRDEGARNLPSVNNDVLANAQCLARGGKIVGGKCIMPDIPKTAGESFIDSLRKQVALNIAVMDSTGAILQNESAALRQEAALKKAGAAAEPYIQKLKEEKDNLKFLQDQKKDYDDLQKQLGQDIAKQTQAADDYIRSLKDQNAEQVFQNSLIGKSILDQQKLTAARKVDLEVKNLIEGWKKNGGSVSGDVVDNLRVQSEKEKKDILDEFNIRKAAEKDWLKGAQDGMHTYLDAAGNMYQQASQVAQNAFKSMEDTLVNFVKTGKLDFKSLADSIISDIIRIQIRQQIANVASSVGGGAGSSSGDFSWAGAISSFFGGARASGGPVSSGSTYLVGEHGPELFTPSGSGRIIPNGALNGGSGGVTVVNNISVTDSGQSSDGKHGSAAELGRKIAGVVKGVIIDEKRSGGLLA